jgi:hypothetical protein
MMEWLGGETMNRVNQMGDPLTFAVDQKALDQMRTGTVQIGMCIGVTFLSHQ